MIACTWAWHQPSRVAWMRTSARASIHGGLSALWSYHLSGADIAAPVDEVFELRPLAREQKLRPRIVEAGLIEPARELVQFPDPPAQGFDYLIAHGGLWPLWCRPLPLRSSPENPPACRLRAFGRPCGHRASAARRN